MCGVIAFFGIALGFAALFNSPWVYIGFITLSIIFFILQLLGVIPTPKKRPHARSNKSDGFVPPDYVIFDDLDNNTDWGDKDHR